MRPLRTWVLFQTPLSLDVYPEVSRLALEPLREVLHVEFGHAELLRVEAEACDERCVVVLSW